MTPKSAPEPRPQTALVTGASSGFGVEFARQLAARGCNLIITARREERLEALRAELAAQWPHVEVDVVPLDLGAPGAPARLYEEASARGRTVDILINNAGFGLHGSFLEIPLERQQEMIDIDVRAVFQLTWLFARPMVERGSGLILVVSSVAAAQPSPSYATYAACKVFVDYMMTALDYELKGTGVSCTVSAPGPSPTEFGQVADQGVSLMHRLASLPPAEVVRQSLDALFAQRPSVAPGWVNASMSALSSKLPRRLTMWSAERIIRD